MQIQKFYKIFGFKIITGAVLLSLILSTIAPVLLYPKPTQAFAPDVVAVNVAKWIWERLKDIIEKASEWGGAVAYRNVLNVILSKIAQDTAEWIGGGFHGSPAFLTQPAPTFWQQAADQAVGEFIDQLAQGTFLKEGLSLCEPIDPTLKFRMLLSVPGVPPPPGLEPTQRTLCSFTQIKENLKEAMEKDFLDISFQLKEGQGFKFEKELSTIIDADEILKHVQEVKHDMKTQHQTLTGLQGKLSWNLLKLAGAIESDNEKGKQEAIDNLKKVQKEIRMQKENLINSKISKAIEKCQGLYHADFCQEKDCYENFCPTQNPQQYCQDNFNTCTQIHGRAKVYMGQLLDWANLIEKNANQALAAAKKDEAFSPEDLAKAGTLEDIQKLFTPEGSDLGRILALQAEGMRREAEAKEAAKHEDEKSQGWLSKLSDISKEVMVPGDIIKKKAGLMVESGQQNILQTTGVVIADALNIFTATLLNKLLDRYIFERGFNVTLNKEGFKWKWFPLAEEGRTGKLLSGPPPKASASDTKAYFADLATVSLKAGGEVNILQKFMICPEDTKYAVPDNCVIDSGFTQAIQENLTIREALEKNLLHGDWLVGGFGVKDTAQDYTHRYSLTNIKKLRRARIVPLGLEIAAQKISSGELGVAKYSLKAVVDGFNQPESPFYHLVNPNWVLKAPPMRCETVAYSAIPLSGSSQRQEVCVDMKDCISENEDGSCNTYAYCTREKNIWRMGGDACDKQYASCQTYQRTLDKKLFSYIRNTLNFDNCDQNNVGCKWYCQRYSIGLAANGQDIWACKEPGKSLSKTDWGGCDDLGTGYYECTDLGNVIFFNRKVDKCDAKSEGCSEFIRTKANLGTNLLPNSSFETYQKEGTVIKVEGWFIDGGEFVEDEDNAKTGKIVAKVNQKWGGPYLDLDLNSNNQEVLGVNLLPNTNYIFSVWVKNTDSKEHTLAVYGNIFANQSEPLYEKELNANSNWERVFYTFNSGNKENSKDLRWEVSDDNGFDEDKFVYFDDVQLEAGENLSSYKEYGEVNKIYLKKAPEWLGCTGNLETDDPRCNDYALKCTKEEVGCELYTPTNGDPALPAVASSNDRCPANCVGYDIFREMDTNFEEGRSAVAFIPATGRSCPVSDVGCEEFTNLDEVAAGGEGKEYYSYIRPCRKPDNQCAYYYTWVGSETTGYQLKRYYLQKDNDNRPDTFLPDSVAGGLWGECDSEDDILTNPHCKQFYDTEGNTYLRLYKNTITCSDDCHPLRKTTPVAEKYCQRVSQSGIPIPGMSYDNGICTYMAIPSEGVTCNKVNAGCREYKGNAAYNVKRVFLDDFEQGTIEPWTNGEYSSESINFGGHSLKVTSEQQQQGMNILFKVARAQIPPSTSRPVQDLVSQGKSYILSFWVKNPGTYSANFGDLDFGSKVIVGNEWQEVKLGPVYFSRQVNSDEKLTISGPDPFYIDNILLKEVAESVYLIKDSWTTPCACDTLDSGNLPDYCTEENTAEVSMIGCREYKDRRNVSFYFKSFTSLCDEEKVGCEALIDTHNSTSPFEEKFNQGEPKTDNVTVPADEMVYLVNDSKKSCPISDKGCQKFGLPNLSVEGAVIGWNDLYLKNNPDLYKNKPILCRQSDENCEEFLPLGSNTPVYFKEPGEKLCEYRTNVILPGQAMPKSGWFKKGTDQACYYYDDDNDPTTPEVPYQPDGMTYGIRWASESAYEGLVGVCPANQSGCTQFTDPATTSGNNMLTNGDFEDGQGDWTYFRAGCPNSCQGTIKVDSQLDPEDPDNKVLYINGAGEAQSEDYYVRYGASQTFEFSKPLPAGTSYRLSGRVYIPSNPNPELEFQQGLRIATELFYSGYQNFTYPSDPPPLPEGYPADLRSCYNGEGNPPLDTCVCDDNNYPKGSEECDFITKILNHSQKVPLTNSDYTYWWNFAHHYLAPAGIEITQASLKESDKDKWLERTTPIIAGGSNNPKNLPLEKLNVLIYEYGFDKGPAKGDVYIDDVKLEPIEPYYYLNNSKLDKSSCQGRVSLEEGCILVSDSSQRTASGEIPAYYNSIATYHKSADTTPPYGLVTPVDCTKTLDCSPESGNENTDYCKYCYSLGLTTNDTNLILKVRRDRVCGEWLTCIDSTLEWDRASGEYKESCNFVGRCNQLVGQGAAEQCANFIYEENPQVLTEEVYKSRDISWAGQDYSGYSIYNMYPVDRLQVKEYANNVYKLTFIDPVTGEDMGVDGNGTKISKTCRAYPEKDSPFKRQGVEDYYQNVNFCNSDDCQCFYEKAEYGGKIMYFNYREPPWLGVCMGGENEGRQCSSNNNCSEGTCLRLSKQTTALGIRGYCLEPDLTKPEAINACLTWYLGSAAAGDPNIHHQYYEAGYQAADNRKWYCGGDVVPTAITDTGFLPDVDDSNYVCSPNEGGGSPYNNGYFVPKGHENETITIENLISNGYVGNQYSDYYHPGIENIILGMVDKIEALLCVDFGGGSTACGNCNDIPHAWKTLTFQEATPPYYSFQASSGNETFEIKVYFSSNSPTAKIYSVQVLFSGAGSSMSDGIWAVVENLKFTFKSGCQKLIKIADPGDHNMTKAYTNRVNNIRNYPGDSIDGKNRENKCEPWGAVGRSTMDTTIFITTSSDSNTCASDQIYSGSIYSSDNLIKDNLFAKSYSFYEYSSDNYQYISGSDFDVTDSNSNLQGRPKVASVKCEGTGNCQLWHENTVTISGIDGTDEPTQIQADKVYGAVLKFYGWADKNQMPIRKLMIDWVGDGNKSLITDYGEILAKNHKPVCCESSESCSLMEGAPPILNPGLNFGNIPDACTPRYFQINKLLFCNGPGSPGWNMYGCHNACCFKPKVYIKDNWGWCNGTGNTYVGDNNSCLTNANAGTQFQGLIIVKP